MRSRDGALERVAQPWNENGTWFAYCRLSLCERNATFAEGACIAPWESNAGLLYTRRSVGGRPRFPSAERRVYGRRMVGFAALHTPYRSVEVWWEML